MEDAVERARFDLSSRLGIIPQEISVESVEEADFPNTALGAPVGSEMSGQMITPGWRIRLSADGESYEYRANRNFIRLYNFKGANYLIA
jgi:hypothetical protein